MKPRTAGWLWAAFATVFLLTSAVALWLLTRPEAAGAGWRAGVELFAAPGATLWWLTLGGPFQTTPLSALGIAWGAFTNMLCWLAVLRLLFVGARLLLRLFARR